MALSALQQTVLSLADRKEVERHLGCLRPSWKRRRLLPASNRYRVRCIEKITQDRTHPNTLKQPDIGRYVAASTILHCMDGWSYLGRALQSYLIGDAGAASHLAYYAELRAAISLLASEGVGVFSQEHCVLGGANGLIALPPPRKTNNPSRPNGLGTHRFVWEALEHWAMTTQSRDLVLNVIRAGGEPLGQWLGAFSTGSAFSGLVAKDWLNKWGLDLKRLADDRNARNLVSYRPTAFTPAAPEDLAETVAFVKALWEACEPLGAMRFHRLDRHLVRLSLETVFVSGHPSNPGSRSRKRAPALFHRQISSMLHVLGPRELTADAWSRFLTFENEPDSIPVLANAAGDAEPTEEGHTRQVLSRATLLLRLASGSSRELLGSMPNFSPTELRFWWDQLGVERALWESASSISNFADLWVDVSEALDTLTQWMNGLKQNEWSPLRMRSECGPANVALGTCERIGLWGML